MQCGEKCKSMERLGVEERALLKYTLKRYFTRVWEEINVAHVTEGWVVLVNTDCPFPKCCCIS